MQSPIDNNANLADIDKFKYLQRSNGRRLLPLRITAQTITGLQISSENYKVAIELLTKHSGNWQIIISRHIECLMALLKVTKENRLQGMHQVYDRGESTVRSLNGIAISTESYGTLTPIIVSKIPPEI